MLEEMGVALSEDGGTVGVFSPKKVKILKVISSFCFCFVSPLAAFQAASKLHCLVPRSEVKVRVWVRSKSTSK